MGTKHKPEKSQYQLIQFCNSHIVIFGQRNSHIVIFGQPPYHQVEPFLIFLLQLQKIP